ncbi:hypothetical protein BUN20_13915 [Bacteroides fragilis]|uniref:Uncharacterized protein n=1 Tax=Bacteroides fragilis TaxID=817 RepID=A0A081U0V1_BACFG|nr:hypothetical protein BUN20_13915 [Bacteroides fragilis]MBY2904632.1 hypothetical protein [Bacteroides fragilis]RGN67874.1 hypothetical protein DXB60_01080 [Bacteroides fragilis]RGX84305.1 hypothetical protein DXA67_16595 [Bacteroides fragilis]
MRLEQVWVQRIFKSKVWSGSGRSAITKDKRIAGQAQVKERKYQRLDHRLRIGHKKKARLQISLKQMSSC